MAGTRKAHGDCHWNSRGSGFKDVGTMYESVKKSMGTFELNLYEVFNQEGEEKQTLEC